MAKKKAAAARVAKPSVRQMQFKIELQDISPPIWRTVVVPSDYTLVDLSYVLIAAMGWDGEHLHVFRFGAGRKKVEYAGWESVEDIGEPLIDGDSVTLDDVILRRGQHFIYEYDFGDSWIHRVVVEKIEELNPEWKLPRCLDGARACPPEDCGGVYAYARLLASLKPGASHPDQGLLEWVGEFDPEQFEVDEINQRLNQP